MNVYLVALLVNYRFIVTSQAHKRINASVGYQVLVAMAVSITAPLLLLLLLLLHSQSACAAIPTVIVVTVNEISNFDEPKYVCVCIAYK